MKRFFPAIQWVGVLFIFVMLFVIFGISLYPGLLFVFYLWNLGNAWPFYIQILVFSLSIFIALFLFGLALMTVVILLRTIFRFNYKEGTYPFHSLNVTVWGFYNSLILLVRYTIMDFIRVTPILPFFHRLMGAKIGKNVQINTKVIADSRLLEIGEGTIIGGDAQIICHSAEGGMLKISRTKIGKDVTIGIMAVILPGTVIGDGARIAACSVVPKNSRIPAYTTWGGVPAREIKSKA